MTSPFDDLLAIADDTFDAINGEPFILSPMVRPANGRAQLDPDRDVVRGDAIFDYTPGEAGGIQVGNRSHARGRNDVRTLVHGRTPTLSITAAVLQGIEVKQGDKVELPDRGARERNWTVVSARPDGHGRIVCELVAS